MEGQGLKISKLILVTHLQGYILETTINIRFMTVTSFVHHWVLCDMESTYIKKLRFK